ncbi:hypothetical protein LSAT2_023647 [Lamellibrachia satsuma]|nr:hypothetical protein LSAT2_023647 [Lamellibrachia satsuma]
MKFSSPLHRRNVKLRKGETYYGFVLGVRYNRTNYLDYKALFDFGLYLPRGNPLGTFTINTTGLKRLLDGDYDQAVGMKRRAKWKQVKNILTMGRILHLKTPQVSLPPPRAVPRSASIKSEGAAVKRKENKPDSQRKNTWPLTGLRSEKKSMKRKEQPPSGSKASLLVYDNTTPPDVRTAYYKRAGYADIDVVLHGKTILTSHASLPPKYHLPQLEWVRNDSLWVKELKKPDAAGDKGKLRLPPLQHTERVGRKQLHKPLAVMLTGGSDEIIAQRMAV